MEATVSKQDESWWEYLMVYDFARVTREEDETEQGICYFTCTKLSCNRALICSQIPGVLRATSELAAGSKPTLVKLRNTTLAVQHHGSILLVLACHAVLPPQCCTALLELLVYLFTMFHGPLEHVYKQGNDSPSWTVFLSCLRSPPLSLGLFRSLPHPLLSTVDPLLLDESAGFLVSLHKWSNVLGGAIYHQTMVLSTSFSSLLTTAFSFVVNLCVDLPEESYSLKGCVKKLENGIFLKDIYLTPEEFSNLTQDHGHLPNGKGKAGGCKIKVQLSRTLSDTSGSDNDSFEDFPVSRTTATDHLNPRSISPAEEATEQGNDMERNPFPLFCSSAPTETCKNGMHHIEEEKVEEGRDNEGAGQKTWEVGMEIEGVKPRRMANWEETSFDRIAVDEVTQNKNLKERGRNPEGEIDEQQWKEEYEESLRGVVEDLSGEMLCGTLLVLSFPPFSIVVLGRQNLRQDVHTLSALKDAAVSTINSLVPRLPYLRSPTHNVPASSFLYHRFRAPVSSSSVPNEETRKDSKVDSRDRSLYLTNDYYHSIVRGSSEILTLSTCDIIPNGLTGDPANPRPGLPLLQVASMLQSGSSPLLQGLREVTVRKGKDSVFAARSSADTMTFYSPPTLPNFPFGTPTSHDSIARLPSLARAHFNKLDSV
uniref:uncharacterized protein isoform X2 n=1 Tax=Myxine glutinosa TaxID=7769 RepID=UPI00358ED967